MAQPISASEVFSDAISRVRSMPPRLLLLLLGLGFTVSFIPYWSENEGGESSEVDLAVGLMLLIAYIMFIWWFTRGIAFAKPDERGKIVPWIAWSIVAGIFAIVPTVAFSLEPPEVPSNLFVEAILVSLGLSLLVPVWAYATGKAIDAEQTTLRQNFALLKKSWIAIAAVLFAFAVVDNVTFELLIPEDTNAFGTLEIATRATIAGVVSTLAITANLAILVSAWRAVARNAVDGETSNF